LPCEGAVIDELVVRIALDHTVNLVAKDALGIRLAVLADDP
jgi:hypothetical protein